MFKLILKTYKVCCKYFAIFKKLNVVVLLFTVVRGILYRTYYVQLSVSFFCAINLFLDNLLSNYQRNGLSEAL